MDTYYKYKAILSAVSSQDDIDLLKTKCPENDIPLINSIIKSLPKENKLSNLTMFSILKYLSTIKYRDEAEKYIKRYSDYQNDPIQKQLLTNIIQNKKYDNSYIDISKISKECPHCGHLNYAPLDTTYIVCGVDPIGETAINVDGCLNDWCFSCGKRLCKNWCINELNNLNNRIHNKECCAKHALENNLKYPDDYCICHFTQI